MKVLNFGSLNIDYVYRVDSFVQPGQTKAVESLSVNCGGKGLNQSVALARAGVETWHAGFVGPEGKFLVEKLAQSGVHTEFVGTAEESTGHAVIQVSDAGQNCILIYPGTNGILTTDYIEEVLSYFVPGDLVLVQNETNLVGEIIRRAKARGLSVAFNAAPMDGRVLDYPLEQVDWLFVNETEGAALTGETDYPAIAAALARRWPDTQSVLTLGAEGCIWTGGGRQTLCKACRVPAVDTTAAGDTFTGFFLRGVLDPCPPLPPLALATAASALAVTRPGAADSIPTLEEVLASGLRP